MVVAVVVVFWNCLQILLEDERSHLEIENWRRVEDSLAKSLKHLQVTARMFRALSISKLKTPPMSSQFPNSGDTFRKHCS